MKLALRTGLNRLVLLFCLIAVLVIGSKATVVRGTIYDSESGHPVPSATIRVEGTGRSILANAEGAYRLRLEPGSYHLKFSHIAFYSHTIELEISDSTITRNIYLKPAIIELEGARVYDRAYDPAQEIIIEAILRKEEILARIHDYRFEAFTKLVIRDTTKTKPEDIALITETQLEAF